MKLPARELNMNHMGQRVTVSQGGATVTGVLRSVHHDANLVSDGRMLIGHALPGYVLGRSSVTVCIIPDIQFELEPHAEVEVTE